MVSSHSDEFFRDLLLRCRARSHLSQQELAERIGIHRRSVQDWEIGTSRPSPERLETLIRVLLEAKGLTPGNEVAEAQALSDAVLRESPRTHAPLDAAWVARLLAQRSVPETETNRSPRVPVLTPAPERGATEHRQDWGDAPDTTGFVARTNELALLRHWVLEEHCRLVTVLGMGGIGKTSLAAKLAQDVAPSFELVYWRSLRDAPPVGEWLAGAISFLSDQQLVLPPSDSERIIALLQLLRDRRCLVVLDNSETLLEPGQHEGRYRAGMAGYGRILQTLGEGSHQSCLLLTSREAPAEVANFSGEAGVIRSLTVEALSIADARALLAGRGLQGDDAAWADLVTTYAGNSLALKVVSETIRDVFGGDIAAFIAYVKDTYGTAVRGIARMMDGQVERRLSPAEFAVLRWLAVEREPITLAHLLTEVGPSIGRGTALEALQSLRRRSLVERNARAADFMLQSVVLEYVTDRLVEGVADEIQRGQPALIVQQPLIMAQAKDYLRRTQERLLAEPILRQLKAQLGETGTEERLLALLDSWRTRPPDKQGYGPGNVVNLMRLLRGHLRGLDLSRLAIRQAYMVATDMQDASLAEVQLSEAALTQAFDHPTSVALSGDGHHVAVGTATGQLYLWRVADRMLLLSIQAHASGIHGLALSTDGQVMASGSEDGTVKLWQTQTGQMLANISGHAGSVPDIALSADGRVVASAGMDTTVRLWSVPTGEPLALLRGHTDVVRGVALSADGQMVVSGADDGTIRLWAAENGGQLLQILDAHTGPVRGVALSANGQLMASGGVDGAIKLWAVRTGRLLVSLQSHGGPVYHVALSAEGGLVAGASQDGTVRLWEAPTGRPVVTLPGSSAGVGSVALSADGRLAASSSHDGTVTLWEVHGGHVIARLEGYTAGVRSVAVSGGGRLVASGSNDSTVKLWDGPTGQLAGALQGHSSGVWGVALSSDGRLLASCSEDGTVKLWDPVSHQLVRTLQAHASAVWGVGLSADREWVASASEDATVKLWEASSGELITTLQGHWSAVWSVALSADRRFLASGGDDGTIRIWATPSGEPLATLRGHSGPVYGVALSADPRSAGQGGQLLASASFDGTVRLWEAPGGAPLAVLEGHTSLVQAIAMSAGGHLVASGSFDRTVRLWSAPEGRLLGTLEGHTGPVFGVALSPDASLVASASLDGTVRLWSWPEGTHLRTLRADRRYERLDITGLVGVTPAQRAALLALGAIEQLR